jgi:hypothetical protein
MKNLGVTFSLVLAIMFQPLMAVAQVTSVTKQELFYKNLLDNPGFENGRARWTASGGSFSTVTSGSNLLVGRVSATWDASAASQTLTSTAVAIPNGLYGANGYASCRILTPSGTATHKFEVFDGTNVLASTDVISSSTPALSALNFIFPSSGNISVRLLSVASNEPLVAIDDCYVGLATNISNVSQATFIGSAFFATTSSCNWSRTNTALGAFPTTAACPGPTVEFNPGPGVIQTTDVDLPRVTVNNLPPGNYQVIFNFAMGGGGTANDVAYTISDGTTTSGRAQSGNSGTSGRKALSLSGNFVYTTAGNRSFEIFGSANTNAVTISNSDGNFRTTFQIYRYPLASEVAVTPDLANWKLDLNISGANVSLGTSNQSSYIAPNNANLTMTVNTAKGSAPAGISCSSTNDNSVGNTTCPTGNEELGFVANFPRAGLVEVCHQFSHSISTTTGNVNTTFQSIRTANGSQTIAEEGGARVFSQVSGVTGSLPHTLCGTFQIPTAAKHTIRLMYEQIIGATVINNQILADADAATGQRDVKITARYIDQQTPMPVIANSVSSTYSGQARIEWATFGGTTEGSNNCTASTCTIYRQSGGVSSVSRSATGDYTVNFSSGVFSAVPTCTCISRQAGVAHLNCSPNFNTNPTATAWRIRNFDLGTPTAQDATVDITCIGPL